ncbi:hypothetical protein HDU76_014063, partial [Blyttiomyces sp. JEL0837]
MQRPISAGHPNARISRSPSSIRTSGAAPQPIIANDESIAIGKSTPEDPLILGLQHRNTAEELDQRRTQRAIALFDYIDRERERENDARREQLANRIWKQHEKLHRVASALDRKRKDREKMIEEGRNENLAMRCRRLVSIHASSIKVHEGSIREAKARRAASAGV